MAAFRAVRIAAIGRMGGGPEADLFARYVARVRPAPVLLELPEAKGSAPEAKRREAAALLEAAGEGAFVLALDQGGAALDTAAFAAMLAEARPGPLCFLIGGAEGLDASVLARADRVLSFGAMTWPHLLARAMLAEQLFRAYSIAIGHPYHRAGRP